MDDDLARTPRAVHRDAHRGLTRLALLAGAWALGYGLYRAYYGVGGTVGMFGQPVSDADWRAINLVAASLLFGAAVLPLLALPLWRTRWARRILLAAAWLIAVACIGHALINDVLRVLSLAGWHEVLYPPGFWLSIDRQAADLQDLVFNETWFLLEGTLWVAIAWTVLGPSAGRRRWVGSAVVAIALALIVGLLSAFGVIDRIVIG